MSFKDLLNQPLPSKRNLQYITEGTSIESISLDSPFGSSYVEIRPREGGFYPHCHIISLSTRNGKTPTAQLCLGTPMYFRHKPSDKTLSGNDLKLLQEEFLKPYKNTGMTVWEYMVKTWNESPNAKKIPPDTKMPDYTTTTETIQDYMKALKHKR